MFPVKAGAVVPVLKELEILVLQSKVHIVDAAGYLSDWSDEEDIDEEKNSSLTADPASAEGDDANSESEIAASKVAHLQKRQRLDVPYCKQCNTKRTQQLLALGEALTDLNKLINSKKTKFVAGPRGLQA
jgi:hypothetical protein